MPVKKLCSRSGCNELIDIGASHCTKHMADYEEQKKERHKHYDLHQRDQKSTEFYHSKEWGTIRAVAYERDNGLCCDCLEEKRLVKGDVVDHITPIKVDWSLRLSLENLRTLCHAHHNAKSAEDKKKYRL